MCNVKSALNSRRTETKLKALQLFFKSELMISKRFTPRNTKGISCIVSLLVVEPSLKLPESKFPHLCNADGNSSSGGLLRELNKTMSDIRAVGQ